MKHFRSVRLLVLLTLVAALASVAPVLAQATKTTLSGQESCSGLVGGTSSHPDGNTHVRGATNICREVATDPRVTGRNVVTFNANLDAHFTGPFWGTFTLTSDEGGVWVGHYEGYLAADDAVYTAVGHGEGRYEGLKLTVWSTGEPFTAEILEPYGN